MSVGPATRAALSSILIHQALRDRDAALHARWHRALEDLNAEPPGPIRHHIEQHDAAVRRAAMTDVLSKGETPTTARIRGAIEREQLVTTTTPERTEPRTHQCVCRLVFYAGTSYMRIDECNAQVGPDQGMCDPCLRDGHHLLPPDQQQATSEGSRR